MGMRLFRGRRTLRLVFLVVCGSLLGWWLFHPRPTDQELIQELVARAEHGVETKSVDEIMSCVSDEYKDGSGLSRRDIWRLAMNWARSSEEAEVVIGSYDIEVASPRATGWFGVTVYLHAGAHRLELPDMQLTVEFEKERRRWRRVWLVKCVTGHDLESMTQDYM